MTPLKVGLKIAQSRFLFTQIKGGFTLKVYTLGLGDTNETLELKDLTNTWSHCHWRVWSCQFPLQHNETWEMNKRHPNTRNKQVWKALFIWCGPGNARNTAQRYFWTGHAFSHLFVCACQYGHFQIQYRPISSGPTTAKHSPPFQGCSLIWDGGADDSLDAYRGKYVWRCFNLSLPLCLQKKNIHVLCMCTWGGVESLFEHESGTWNNNNNNNNNHNNNNNNNHNNNSNNNNQNISDLSDCLEKINDMKKKHTPSPCFVSTHFFCNSDTGRMMPRRGPQGLTGGEIAKTAAVQLGLPQISFQTNPYNWR